MPGFGFIEVSKKEINMKEIETIQLKRENQEKKDYRRLRKEYPEQYYDIIKFPGGWAINPKQK
jgi:hypothetical protein